MRRAVTVGLVAGTCLAGLPYAENDQCVYDARETEGYSGAMTLWPLGTRCDYTGSDARSVLHRATAGEGIAWVALASLLFALAMLTRSAWARGAAHAAALLAALGLLWHSFELLGAGFAVVTCSPPFVYMADRFLRRTPGQQRITSLLTAAVLGVWVPVAWVFASIGGDYVAIGPGVLAGAAVVAGIEAFARRQAHEPVPAH